MSHVIQSIKNFAHLRPNAVAIADEARCLTYAELLARVTELGGVLQRQGCDSIALHADNGPEWIIADLAAWYTNKLLVPVPPFFTAEQVNHLYSSGGIDTVITSGDTAGLYASSSDFERLGESVAGLSLFSRDCGDGAVRPIARDCCKITFTSGSTGTPKGVMLSGSTIDAVTRRLVAAFADTPRADLAISTRVFTRAACRLLGRASRRSRRSAGGHRCLQPGSRRSACGSPAPAARTPARSRSFPTSALWG